MKRGFTALAIAAVACLAIGASVAGAGTVATAAVDPVPGYLLSQCVVNGVTYLSDDASENEWSGSCPSDEGPSSGVTGICIDNVPYNYVSDDQDNVAFSALINSSGFGHTAAPCTPPINRAASTWIPSGPDRYIFCAAQGNTDLNGKAIVPGSSLNIFPDQAMNDSHYKGASIGFWVPGEGATCSLTPAQASLAATSTKKVNHVGGTGDINQPEVYIFVG
jgi:hypothetical protein